MNQAKPSFSHRHFFLLFILMALAISVVLFSTTPSSVGPGGITVLFVLIYGLSLSLMEWVYQGWLAKKKTTAFWLRAVYAAAPVSVLALSSLRQLTTTDLAVGALLLIMISVYHNRHMA